MHHVHNTIMNVKLISDYENNGQLFIIIVIFCNFLSSRTIFFLLFNFYMYSTN